MARILMTRAFDENGHIVDVKDVVSGKACNCTCIGCQGAVWAMKGQVKAHYFAHEPNSIEQNACTWKPETEIHILAKEVLSTDRQLILPIGTINPIHKNIVFDEMVCEVYEGRVIPDVIGFIDGEKVLIEVAVTHFCDRGKIKELKRVNATCVELDLSGFRVKEEIISKEEIRDYLKKCPKKWVSVAPVGNFSEMIYSHNRQQLLSLQHQYSSLSSKHQTEVKKLNAEFDAIKNTRESELSDMQIVIQQARNAERNASSILEQWDRIRIDKESSISEIEDKIILLEDQYRSFEIELKERLYKVQEEIDKKQDLLNDLLNLDELKAEFYSHVDDINRTIKAKEAQLDASEVEIRRRSASLDLIQKNLNDSLISLQERENALTERAKNLASIVDVNSREQAQVMLSQWIKEKSNEIKALEEKERRTIKAIDDLRRKYGSFIKIP
ncbi:hypothetical protein LA366_11110 [Aeromonas jandaei]|uniref:Uncharacterized protein n=1 Tax=Aeromonas jandaei TaxID=650 RepID=A0A7T4DPP2_AERJA|nr:hypothetical protein [Aeromonas jandaei]QQB20870.1 hypothetical protein I6H43_04890 [Aeromonas jandaei]UCA31679.1 hypothetical protein LA366_11110 [Aeromonas jandaei]